MWKTIKSEPDGYKKRASVYFFFPLLFIIIIIFNQAIRTQTVHSNLNLNNKPTNKSPKMQFTIFSVATAIAIFGQGSLALWDCNEDQNAFPFNSDNFVAHYTSIRDTATGRPWVSTL